MIVHEQETVVTSTSENLASTAVTESSTATERYYAALQAGEASQDKIISLTLSLAFLRLLARSATQRC